MKDDEIEKLLVELINDRKFEELGELFSKGKFPINTIYYWVKNKEQRINPANAVYALGLVGSITVSFMPPEYHLFDVNVFKDIVPLLISLLDDEDPDIRSSAVNGLCLIEQMIGQSTDSAIPKYAYLLDDKASSVRSSAARALGFSALSRSTYKYKRKIISTLVILLDDEDPKVRGWAAWTLGRKSLVRKTLNTTVTKLITLLDDKDRFVRRKAAYALGNIPYRRRYISEDGQVQTGCFA